MAQERLRASTDGFKQIQKALEETQELTGWSKDSEEWSKYACKVYDPSWTEDDEILKGFSQPTWKRFYSLENGKTQSITAKVFKTFCKMLQLNWEDIVDKTDSGLEDEDLSINFVAYEDTWVGRQDLINKLKNKLLKLCRIVILNGITGIGKTALAEKLYIELTRKIKWKKILRVNFDNQAQADFGNFFTVAQDWLQECDILVIPEDRQNISRLQEKLIEYWKANPCLIIIDSLEWILKGNQKEGWSEFKEPEWGIFLRTFLLASPRESRIIITTQHLPEDVSAGYANFWFCQSMKGLESFEQLELFKKIGVIIDEQKSSEYLERIGKVYEGHPLALKVIARTIKREYQGNILAYWKEEGQEIEKVEKDLEKSQEDTNLEESWKIHKANSNLYYQVCKNIDKTFDRLKQYNYHAYLLICLASTYLSPHSKEDWLELLDSEGYNKGEQKRALRTLMEEELVEGFVQDNTIFYRLHNLIRSVAKEHFDNLE